MSDTAPHPAVLAANAGQDRVVAAENADGVTLDDLREFLTVCDELEVAGGSLIHGWQLTDDGLLRRLAAIRPVKEVVVASWPAPEPIELPAAEPSRPLSAAAAAAVDPKAPPRVRRLAARKAAAQARPKVEQQVSIVVNEAPKPPEMSPEEQARREWVAEQRRARFHP